MDDQSPPPSPPPNDPAARTAWRLIAVLFSSQPLDEQLAFLLYNVARDLYERDLSSSPIAGDLVQGTIRNLGQKKALGDIIGPAFEAEIDTERGHQIVHFLLTREAVRDIVRRPPTSMLN
jgi:hypothetical protein